MRDSVDPPTGSSNVTKKHVSVCLIVALGGFTALVPENRLDAVGPSSQRNEVAQKPLTNFDYIDEEGMEVDDETPLPQLIAGSPTVIVGSLTNWRMRLLAGTEGERRPTIVAEYTFAIHESIRSSGGSLTDLTIQIRGGESRNRVLLPIEPQVFAAGRQYLILLGYDYGGGSFFLPNGRADVFDVTDRLVKPVGRTVVAKAQSGRRTTDFLAEVRRLATAQER